MNTKVATHLLTIAMLSLLFCPASSSQNGGAAGYPIIGGMQPSNQNNGQSVNQQYAQPPARRNGQGIGRGTVQSSTTPQPQPNAPQANGAEHHTKVAVTEITGLSTDTQTFQQGSHSFAITPTAGTRLQVMQKGSGKSFNFLGPLRQDSSFSIFSVMILVANESHPMPSKEQLLQKVLLPYKTRMTGYAANPYSLNLGGGHQESGIEYSGTFENTKARGFFVVIPVNDCFYVISGSDRYNEYDQARQTFDALAASLDIKS